MTVEDLRLALLEFRETYNAICLIEPRGLANPNKTRRRLYSRAVAT